MIFRKAVLIIHGFAGGTYDEEELAFKLELNKTFDVFQFTLPGHDKALSKVNYQEWIKSSEEKVELLINNGYNNIYLIGHSMGGVIATYLATKYKQIKKIVLAAPAFHYLNVIKDDLNIKESLKKIPKVIDNYKDEIVGRVLKLDVSAIRQLMSLIKEYYDSPIYVNCPTLILQGLEDHLVPKSSSEYVYNTLSKNVKKLIYIEGINHEIFKSNKKEKIYNIVEAFLKYNMIGGIDTI